MANLPRPSSTSLRHAPMAPGTTETQLSSASARRSTFCAVMYSSACQRVSRFTRLPTLALPATAATCGSAKWAARWARAPGSSTVSASITTSSVCASLRPWFRALALPPLATV